MESENDKLSQNSNFNNENFIETTEKIVVVPVIHEEVTIDKKMVDKATVRLSKSVTENLEDVTVPLTHEDIHVERVPKNEFVDMAPPSIRYEGDIMIISVTKEVAVVEKRLVLVEELHVTKNKTETSETHQVLLRKEEVNVERKEINDTENTSR